MRNSFFAFLAALIACAILFTGWGCGSTPLNEACLNNGDPLCGCRSNPEWNLRCTDQSGRPGINVCASNGIGLVCDITGTGNGTGTGTSTNTGGNAPGGKGIYSCETDPRLTTPTPCSITVGACQATGKYVCNVTKDGSVCDAVVPANCIPPGGGKETADGGVAPNCVPANARVQVIGTLGLGTLCMGDSTVGAGGNDQTLNIVANKDCVVSVGDGITVNVLEGSVFVHTDYVPPDPSNDPTDLMDDFHCKLSGVTSGNPTDCKQDLVGKRFDLPYMTSISKIWDCKNNPNNCPFTIPGDFWRYFGSYASTGSHIVLKKDFAGQRRAMAIQGCQNLTQ